MRIVPCVEIPGNAVTAGAVLVSGSAIRVSLRPTLGVQTAQTLALLCQNADSGAWYRVTREDGTAVEFTAGGSGRSGNTDVSVTMPCLIAGEYYHLLSDNGRTFDGVAEIEGGLGAGEGGLLPFPLASFFAPGVPPTTPDINDDEFNGGTLGSDWDLYSHALSSAPVVWVPAVLDEATVEAGSIFRYQLNAPACPSALCMQPSSDSTIAGGVARRLVGASPENWLMTAGVTFGVTRDVESGASPNFEAIIFMANDAPNNGHGSWDYQNFVAVHIQADYTGIIIRGIKTVAGSTSVFSSGNTVTLGLGEPAQFQLRKTGDHYSVAIRFSNGQKLTLMSDTTTLAPVRFGFNLSSHATPQPVVPLAYIRHRFNALDF